jgi:hypothetical protein
MLHFVIYYLCVSCYFSSEKISFVIVVVVAVLYHIIVVIIIIIIIISNSSSSRSTHFSDRCIFFWFSLLIFLWSLFNLETRMFLHIYIAYGPSQWSGGLRHKLSSPDRTLWSWVRIPLEVWMSVCFFSVFVLFCV